MTEHKDDDSVGKFYKEKKEIETFDLLLTTTESSDDIHEPLAPLTLAQEIDGLLAQLEPLAPLTLSEEIDGLLDKIIINLTT